LEEAGGRVQTPRGLDWVEALCDPPAPPLKQKNYGIVGGVVRMVTYRVILEFEEEETAELLIKSAFEDAMKIHNIKGKVLRVNRKEDLEKMKL
jgi:hypothetical protein